LIDTNEWRSNSYNGLVCSIILCHNTPTNQCSICSLHYCYEHVKTHIRPTTTATVEAT